MIYTFQKINSTKRYFMYAKNKESAFTEMNVRFGSGHEFSLIAYCEAEYFALFVN